MSAKCKRCEELEQRCKDLEDALHWYVRHDTTNEGGTWEVANAMWLAGKRRAMRLLGLEVVVPS